MGAKESQDSGQTVTPLTGDLIQDPMGLYVNGQQNSQGTLCLSNKAQ